MKEMNPEGRDRLTTGERMPPGPWAPGGRGSPHLRQDRTPGQGRRPLPMAQDDDGRQDRSMFEGRTSPKGIGGKPVSLAALRRRELDLVAGFSETSKMPWLSWSTPASRCRLGSRLRPVAGSVCEHCYAFERNYRWDNVQQALERRFEKLADLSAWTEGMVSCLTEHAARFSPRLGHPWPAFRWHDSGDLQSAEHLAAICEIAERTQGVPLSDGTVEDIRFWLPTREYGYVQEALGLRGVIPRNLCVRLSAHMVDGAVPTKIGLPVSSVHSQADVYPDAHECPAYRRSPPTCGSCRACWDNAVQHVTYPVH